MKPEEMRQLLIEEARLYWTPELTEAGTHARGLVPFLEKLPDDDPELMELSGLLDNRDDWEPIAELLRSEQRNLWSSTREHRDFVEEALQLVRAIAERNGRLQR